MIVVAFVLFAALVLAWLISPGEVGVKLSVPALEPVLEPVASPAD